MQDPVRVVGWLCLCPGVIAGAAGYVVLRTSGSGPDVLGLPPKYVWGGTLVLVALLLGAGGACALWRKTQGALWFAAACAGLACLTFLVYGALFNPNVLQTPGTAVIIGLATIVIGSTWQASRRALAPDDDDQEAKAPRVEGHGHGRERASVVEVDLVDPSAPLPIPRWLGPPLGAVLGAGIAFGATSGEPTAGFLVGGLIGLIAGGVVALRG